MRQLTVRGVDDELHTVIKREAQNKGISINRYVLEVLQETLHLKYRKSTMQRFHDLDNLAGTWDDDQAVEFDQFLAKQRQIDENIW